MPKNTTKQGKKIYIFFLDKTKGCFVCNFKVQEVSFSASGGKTFSLGRQGKRSREKGKPFGRKTLAFSRTKAKSVDKKTLHKEEVKQHLRGNKAFKSLKSFFEMPTQHFRKFLAFAGQNACRFVLFAVPLQIE